MKVTKKLIDLVRRRTEIDAEIKAYDEEKKGITEEIKGMLIKSGDESVAVDVDGVGYAVTLQIRKGSSKVVPTKLLELGVEPSVIVAATVTEKDSEPFVSVREIKEKKGRGKGEE